MAFPYPRCQCESGPEITNFKVGLKQKTSDRLPFIVLPFPFSHFSNSELFNILPQKLLFLCVTITKVYSITTFSI